MQAVQVPGAHPAPQLGPTEKTHMDTSENEQLRQRVVELEQQILGLQRKLDALHATDLNSLKRAHKTLTQHVQALNVDSAHISKLVSNIETSLLTPTFIAQEAGIMASAVGAVWVLDRGLRMVRLPMSGVVTRVALVSALGVLTWRLMRSSGAHISKFFRQNKTIKQQLQQDWEAVRRRVEIMVHLTAS